MRPSVICLWKRANLILKRLETFKCLGRAGDGYCLLVLRIRAKKLYGFFFSFLRFYLFERECV